MRRALPLPLLAAAAILASLPASATAACSAVPSLSSADTATARAAVLCAVNAERSARGLTAYTGSDQLDQAAQGYSGDMVAQAFFDHVSPTGSTVVDRARATGWTTGSFSLGEAIVFAGAPLDSAAGIVALWMGSPGHRAILLDPSYREVGIGVADGVPDGSGAAGSTVVLDAGVRSAGATATASGTTSTTTAPASGTATKVAAWRSARTCARAAKRSRKARARCASISKRSKASSRARRHSSTRRGTIWMVRRTSLRATS